MNYPAESYKKFFFFNVYSGMGNNPLPSREDSIILVRGITLRDR